MVTNKARWNYLWKCWITVWPSLWGWKSLCQSCLALLASLGYGISDPQNLRFSLRW